MRAISMDYAIRDKCCFLRISGEIRYSTNSGLEKFSSIVFKDHELDNFVIDLSNADFIDSTNLGILASIANNLARHSRSKPVIISRKKDISIVLHSMGFEQFFNIVDESPDDPDLTYLGIHLEKRSIGESEREILEAHKTLAAMNSKNHEIFKDVIELLEKESGNKS